MNRKQPQNKLAHNGYDVAIIGAGMVGLAMAAALAQTNLKILIIEKNELAFDANRLLSSQEPVELDDIDIRVSAISPANIDFLNKINAWQAIPNSRQGIYDQMHVWDGDGSGAINFTAAQVAKPYLGVIVENRIIQAALLKTIEAYGNVQCQFGDELESIDVKDDHVEILLKAGDIFTGRLVVGADGANSVVKKKLDIETHKTDYDQVAFVANVRTEKPHENTAWQRFISSGPVAFLPLADEHLCSVVWSVDSEKAQELNPLTTEAFAAKLGNAFESRLGGIKEISRFQGFPLVKRHAKNYLSPRVALVGDAAHTIHPLAGQGVNLGFQDVSHLTKLVEELYQESRDIGLKENLRPFERARKTENLMVQNAMSGFKMLFANQSMPITLLRNFGLSALNEMPSVKELIVKKAMGY